MINDFTFEEASLGEILENESEINFIVSEKQFSNILSDINNKLDEDKFIIDASNCQREIAKDGDEIRLSQLGGIMTGSKIFIKRNIASFSEHLIELKSRQKSQ